MSVEEFLMSVAILNGHSPDTEHLARQCKSCNIRMFTPKNKYVWEAITSTCSFNFQYNFEAFSALLLHIKTEWPGSGWT